MRAEIPFDLLLAIRRATAEKYGEVRRVLGLPVEADMHCEPLAAAKESAEMGRTLELVSEIHREIMTIRHERQALKSAKERLEQMQAEKLFAFTNKIDVESFRILCAVLAHGDVAKASRALNVPENTLRSRVNGWPQRGPAYQVLSDLVRWRKAMGNKGTVMLNESITQATATSTDFAGLLSDVLDELLTMTDENWTEKVEALAELLRPHAER